VIAAAPASEAVAAAMRQIAEDRSLFHRLRQGVAATAPKRSARFWTRSRRLRPVRTAAATNCRQIPQEIEMTSGG
jgi:uncharacterized Zn finger protein